MKERDVTLHDLRKTDKAIVSAAESHVGVWAYAKLISIPKCTKNYPYSTKGGV